MLFMRSGSDDVHSFALLYSFLFFNDTATTEIYTLSLHDALPIWKRMVRRSASTVTRYSCAALSSPQDRKSTRLNSSHGSISYAVFCLQIKSTPQPPGTGRSTRASLTAGPHDDTPR